MVVDILDYSIEELKQFLNKIGIAGYRAAQINSWLYKGVYSFDDMKNISKSDIEILKANAYIGGEIYKHSISDIDGTEKFLFGFHDNATAEGVLMNYEYGTSACISTQSGCRMGCMFCASSKIAFSRSLTAGEMLYEIIKMQHASGKRINHIVLMGIGEPLDNYDNTLRFLRLINSKDSLNIGMRNISLSTCGIVPEIYRLASEQLQLTLSISLHAPDNETRSKIMPINRKYPIEELIKACDDYFKITGRRISYEYSLIDGMNDSEESCRRLIVLLRGKNCHVNLIRLNNISDSPLKPSRRVDDFLNMLKDNGINATLRRRIGTDINGACGQLRRQTLEHSIENKTE